MINFFKKLLGLPTDAEKAEAKALEAPYKIEAKPANDLSDIAIAQHPATVAEKASEAVVTSIAPVKKKAPRKQGAPKKPASNKPRKPKVPKA